MSNIFHFRPFTQAAFMFGQWPKQAPTNGLVSGTVAAFFPENMDTNSLYPLDSSVFTFEDGTTTAVPCFIPGEAQEIPKVSCPYPFVNPIAGQHFQSCVQPCPVQAYTDNEYTWMWGIGNVIGIVGLLLNLFMACTWFIAGKKCLAKQPYQLKFCVFSGVIYGMVGTLPSLILKYDLACDCPTEEW